MVQVKTLFLQTDLFTFGIFDWKTRLPIMPRMVIKIRGFFRIDLATYRVFNKSLTGQLILGRTEEGVLVFCPSQTYFM